MVDSEISFAELRKIIDSQIEWLAVDSNGKSFALQKDEIEIEFVRDKLLLGFLDGKGFQNWRVVDWKYKNTKLGFKLSRNFNRENTKLELVPRTASSEFVETVELARIEKAADIARSIIENQPKAKLIRVELNKEHGRFAQIVFESFGKKRTAVLADVSDTLTPEILLTSAILWLEKLSGRKNNPIETVWIIAEKKNAKALQKIHALLRENRKRKIKIWEFVSSEPKENTNELKELESLDFQSLFSKKSKKNQTVESKTKGETALRILELAPEEIHISPTKNGETLSFKGLTFAKIRKILNDEKIWFGVESNRLFLSGNNYGEFAKLVDELKTYRRHDSPNRQHFYYKHAPEAWLESILRQNIKILDANLILSPLYNQFRAERDKIDLLAIRRDGRIVVIEVKTAPDREMIFQAADYWRKIEAERRAGNLQTAKFFGSLEIKDEPALVYLVAPLLSYHKDFDFLAQTISPEIEIYRFDINENWRENLKIVRRRKVTSDK